MKRLLVNATQSEEMRVAMVDGQHLYNLDIESPARESRKANIYKGVITRVEPSLEAAFVDYGAERHGFLPLKEIGKEYLSNYSGKGKPNIKEVLKEGTEVVVQVEKDERGNKGAALTTFISLAGRYLVCMPTNAKAGGVSRRIEGKDRNELRQVMNNLKVPDGMGAIARTAAVGRNVEELQWDLDYLVNIANAIYEVSEKRKGPFLIYQENKPILRALRDHFSGEVGEIVIDNDEIYQEAKNFVAKVMPQYERKVKLYNDDVPLFNRFQIEGQINSAFAHTVDLPSGGSVVFDRTEALTSIDINSARATKGGDIEATALNTNLEAAEEIARQLRIRDLGGLIVIDFIDMYQQRNQKEVERRMKESVRHDRARIQIGRISRFGLMEMSRQRLRPSLSEANTMTCPRCSGLGSIRDVESLSLSILRLIGDEARKDNTSQVVAQLPVDVSTYLLNEKREWVAEIETRNNVRVIVLPDAQLETPHFHLRRIKGDEMALPENQGSSVDLASKIEDLPLVDLDKFGKKQTPEVPAVANILPETPAPQHVPKKKTQKPVKSRKPTSEKAPVKELGLIKRVTNWFTGSATEKPTSEEKVRKDKESRERKDSKSRQPRGKQGQDKSRSGKQQSRGKQQGQKSQNQKRNERGRGQSKHKTQSDRSQSQKGKQQDRKQGQRKQQRSRDENSDVTDTKSTDTQIRQDNQQAKQQSGEQKQGRQRQGRNRNRNRRRNPRSNEQQSQPRDDKPQSQTAEPVKQAAQQAKPESKSASVQPEVKRAEQKVETPVSKPAAPSQASNSGYVAPLAAAPDSKPENKQSEAMRFAPSKPEVSAAPKPAAPKPATPKPAAPKPAAPKPAAPEAKAAKSEQKPQQAPQTPTQHTPKPVTPKPQTPPSKAPAQATAEKPAPAKSGGFGFSTTSAAQTTTAPAIPKAVEKRPVPKKTAEAQKETPVKKISDGKSAFTLSHSDNVVPKNKENG